MAEKPNGSAPPPPPEQPPEEVTPVAVSGFVVAGTPGGVVLVFHETVFLIAPVSGESVMCARQQALDGYLLPPQLVADLCERLANSIGLKANLGPQTAAPEHDEDAEATATAPVAH